MSDHLVTAERYFGVASPDAYHDYLMQPSDRVPYGQIATREGVDPASVGRPGAVDRAAEPVALFVEHGRVFGQCDECRAVMYATPGWPFMCFGGCFNTAAGRRYRPTTVPENFDEIAAALLERGNPKTRNWSATPRPGWDGHGETPAELRAETEARALDGVSR